MQAIRVIEFGDPSVLKLVDLDRPEPGMGEVLLRVAFAGVNYTDITQRRGRPGQTVPYLPGVEASGVVEALGPEVSDVAVGDRVATIMVPGTYAEYIVAPESRLVRLPDWIDLTRGAAFAMQGITAHYLLREFERVRSGMTVLVHAAAGGVGLLLTRWAVRLGARVIGTTSTTEKAENVRAAGASGVIVYSTTSFVDEVRRLTGGAGVDLVLDGVGKTTFSGDLEAVRDRGHIVIYGGASGLADPIVPNALMRRGLTVSGGSLGYYIATRNELQSRADDVLAGLREGWLQLNIERIFPLAEASEAHRLLESRLTSGKILLAAGETAQRGAS
jgi:NADPH2:quinone reductase